MTCKRALLLTSAWLGLARTAPVAHACTCLQAASWYLELESIDDISAAGVTGDLEGEQGYWPTEASLSGATSILLGNGHYIGLTREP